MNFESGKPEKVHLKDLLITTDLYRDDLFKFLFAVCYGYKWFGNPVVFKTPRFLFMWPDRQQVRAYIIDEEMLHTIWWFRNQFLKMFKVWGLMATPAVIFSLLIVFSLRMGNTMTIVVLFSLVAILSLFLPVRMGTTAKKKVNDKLKNYTSVTVPDELSRSNFVKTVYHGREEKDVKSYSEMMKTFVGQVYTPPNGQFTSNSVNNLKELFASKAFDRFSRYYSEIVLAKKGDTRDTDNP